MPKFELGFAFRGSTAPEVKQVVEASSIREAMLKIIDQYGGDDVVLVTHAHPSEVPEAQQPCPECVLESSGGPISFSATKTRVKVRGTLTTREPAATLSAFLRSRTAPSDLEMSALRPC